MKHLIFNSINFDSNAVDFITKITKLISKDEKVNFEDGIEDGIEDGVWFESKSQIIFKKGDKIRIEIDFYIAIELTTYHLPICINCIVTGKDYMLLRPCDRGDEETICGGETDLFQNIHVSIKDKKGVKKEIWSCFNREMNNIKIRNKIK